MVCDLEGVLLECDDFFGSTSVTYDGTIFCECGSTHKLFCK